MLPTSEGVEPATSWSPVGQRIQLSHRGRHHQVLERIVDSLIRQLVSTNDFQFGFVPGSSTTDAIFVVRLLQEKYLTANKRLYMAVICGEVLRPSEPNGVMSSVVSLPNHTFTGQA